LFFEPRFLPEKKKKRSWGKRRTALIVWGGIVLEKKKKKRDTTGRVPSEGGMGTRGKGISPEREKRETRF